MKNFVKTREMELGPVRVPVMIQKNVANELATFLREHDHGQAKYDAAMERIIQLGIEAAKRERAY
ncbi:MAG: hypothetical protein M0R80_07335 [Proteobacteria bacterium]|jgi:hypothetical protein|nr:hypothetical protein [Pseudomonadota bacterium]